MKKKIKHSWSDIGKQCGYPDCCIKSFINEGLNFKKNSSVDNNALYGTGFVPCLECAKLPPDEMIEIINSHRIFERPFPFLDEYTIKECEEIVKSLIRHDKYNFTETFIKTFKRKPKMSQGE